MKFLAIASTLLLAGSAAAAPGTAIRRERSNKRAAARKSSLIHKVAAPLDYETNKTNVEYSNNWAGAILVGTGYTEVTGTFTVPKPSTAGSGSAWVGIDGDTCECFNFLGYDFLLRILCEYLTAQKVLEVNFTSASSFTSLAMLNLRTCR